MRESQEPIREEMEARRTNQSSDTLADSRGIAGVSCLKQSNKTMTVKVKILMEIVLPDFNFI